MTALETISAMIWGEREVIGSIEWSRLSWRDTTSRLSARLSESGRRACAS
jgi:hypothetical protein